MSTILSPVFINPQQQQFFEANGYVKIQLLDEAQITQLTEVFNAIYPVAPEKFSTSINYDGTEHKKRIQQAVYEVFLPKLAPVLANFKPLIGSFLTKRYSPESKLDLHQDWTFVDESKGFISLNVWCPLVATNAENGNLCIVPKTHLLPRALRTAPASDFPYGAYRELYEPLAQAIPTKAGEAIIYDNALFHGSPANMTSELRLVAGILMIPEAAEGRLYYKSSDGQYLEYLADEAFYIDKNPLFEQPDTLLQKHATVVTIDNPQEALCNVLGLPYHAPATSGWRQFFKKLFK